MARLMRWTAFATLMVTGSVTAAAASCEQVAQLFRQGLSEAEIATALGAPIAAVQSCTRQRPFVSAPAGPAPFGAAGPAPLGAAGPAPLGAAGPAPLGAAGPAPLGAAGPAPWGAAGPAPVGSTTNQIKKLR